MIRPIFAVAFAVSGLAVAIFACSGETAETPASGFGTLPDASRYDGGGGNDPILVEGDGSSNQPLTDASREWPCYELNFIDGGGACRRCCYNQHAEGRKVFTGALDDCLCQPSKCGAQCAEYNCASPQVRVPLGSDCEKCVTKYKDEMGDAGANTPDASSPIDGGLYPELGIPFCGSYASNLCRENAECMAVDRCITFAKCK